jgi:hypothetical protein
MVRVLAGFLFGLALAACDVPGLPDGFAPNPTSCNGPDGWPGCPCRAVTNVCVEPGTFCGPAGLCQYAVPV